MVVANDLWPYEEARGILEHLGTNVPEIITLETGFGPSGPPHIGTFGEVIRTKFVQLALEDMGHRARIISFSDDMDGLRKIPEGFPSHSEAYLGRPVSTVPDPFGCHESYSLHMHSLLVDMVTTAGVQVEFKLSSREYKAGTFNEEIRTVLRNREKVAKIVSEDYSVEVQRTWFPFFVICENCGNLYTTRVVDADPESGTVRYACDQHFAAVNGCGHLGLSSALDGRGKLPWKVDWAARWHRFSVDYEIYGKDLIESARASDRICSEIFNSKPPKHMFYELFLSEEGAKLSKSKGEALSPQAWLKYGTLESLFHLFLTRPRTAKRISLNRVPTYLAEVSKLEDEYYEKGPQRDASERTVFDFLTLFKPPVSQPKRADFSILVGLIGALGMTDLSIIRSYASNMLAKQGVQVSEEELDQELTRALAFYLEVVRQEEMAIQPEEIDFDALDEFVDYLLLSEHSAEEIHSRVFEIAREHSIDPKAFFRTIYLLMLRQERGPRLGNFIKLLGQSYTANVLMRKSLRIQQTKDIDKLRAELATALAELERRVSMAEAEGKAVATQVEEIAREEKGQEDVFPRQDIAELERIQKARTVPTKKLFGIDPYQREFEAIVTAVQGTRVSLDQTCFYPESGGQAGDSGSIEGQEVLNTQYGETGIIHIFRAEPQLKVGQKVRCSIDWERRYLIMKLHSASHVMEAKLHDVFGPIERTGSFVNEKHDRSTFKYAGKLSKEKLAEVEELVNQFMSRNLDIHTRRHPRFSEITYWACGELVEACGGTHPRNTSEIGKVRISRTSGGTGKETVVTSLVKPEASLTTQSD